MSMIVRPYSSDLEDSVMKLSHKAWALFKHNKDFEHQKMSCVFNEDSKLITVGYVRQGIADDYNVMEIVIHVNEEGSERIDEVRKIIYPSLVDICLAIRNPGKKTKLVAWDDFDGDREFFIEQGFSSSYQKFYFAKQSLSECIPKFKMPSGVTIRHHSMKTKEERVKYTELEKQFYQGVVNRSINMLEWMMGGPELHTIGAYEGEELVGSVMCWQTGAVERLFVIPRWRNKGLSEFLITKAFEYHLKNGRINVETLVNEQEKDKLLLLESMGYSFPVKLELLALDIQ
ncbi:GNAT family N-acetyltransferase [Paenibacillus sp. NPDC056579]|uniref:GNAT family N-acetyltransferase n=1 Tax=Paenibacillus sp. NPDC056579 TaxID=3345871 RepID=UPI0036B53DDA